MLGCILVRWKGADRFRRVGSKRVFRRGAHLPEAADDDDCDSEEEFFERSNALADAIERLADDGELRSQMGRAAHLDVERVFGAIPVGKAIAELYGHALKLSATITNDGEPNQ